MTPAEVQGWLDRYVDAWLTYDPAAIGDLFSADAEYRYHPYDEPEVGRDTIVRDWVDPEGGASTRDPEGTYEAHYEPFAVDGSRAVAIGESRYYTDATKTKLEREYRNCYLLEFDGDGRCSSFTEYYMKAPDAPS
jgi:hypothetical protein